MKKILIFPALLVLFFSQTSARIHQVPSPHLATIQGGIDIAKNSDTVLVMPGVYYENINFKGKKILVASNFIFDQQDSTILITVIEGNDTPPPDFLFPLSVVTFDSGEDTSSSIQGFTIKNGRSMYGSGLFCLDSSPKISHNVISGNFAIAWLSPGSAAGGGVGCYNSSAIIEYNRIINNLCVVGGEDGGFGGGIFLMGKGIPIVRYNLIAYNNSDSGFGTGYGGGIFNGESSLALIYNNTIVSNNAEEGGGICNANISSGTRIFNNVIAFNSQGIRNGYFFFKEIQPVMSYNDFFGNAKGNFFGFSPDVGDTTWGLNSNGTPCDSFYNIIRDPLFVDTAKFDFHLSAYSPCIDAGDPKSPLDPDSTIADIGAFYYPHGHTYVADDEGKVPEEFELSQNYPNPFNPTTTIPFQAGSREQAARSPIHTTLKIYNILGQLVRVLVDEEKAPGNYNVTWDGRDDSGKDVGSGIYFYQLKSGNFTATKKMVLVR